LYDFRLGEVCSHAAAILFKMEACARLGYNKVACTSQPCQWNQNFTKKVCFEYGLVLDVNHVNYNT